MSLPLQQTLKYLNLAREYPKYYVPLIDQQLNSFVDDANIKLQTDILYETVEGKTAWEEAKKFIMNQPPLRALDYHQGLTQAAYDHAQDLIKNPTNGHKGSDGSTFVQRIQRYCKKGKGNLIQILGNVHTVPGQNSIELAILNLIVDDGVANRGHRKALFSKDYKYVGVEFVAQEERIISVVTMSQNNLELLKAQSQNIATSTSHLQTMAQIGTPSITESVLTAQRWRENSLNKQQKSDKQGVNTPRNGAENGDGIWTLNNMTNESIMTFHCKSSQQKLYLDGQPCKPIIYKYNNLFSSPNSQTIKAEGDKTSNTLHPNPKTVEYYNSSQDPSKHKTSPPIIKQSSLKQKSPPQSAKSHNSSRLSAEGLGVFSQISEMQIKSPSNYHFMKSSAFSSSIASTNKSKKIVEKKQTMRSWSEDEFLVRQVTTTVKYSDGTMESSVEKHSLLQDISN